MLYIRFILMITLLLSAELLSQPVQWDTVSLESPFMLYNERELDALRTKMQSDTLGMSFYTRIYQQCQARSDDQTQRAKIAKSIAFVVAIGRDLNGQLTPHARGEMLTVLLDYLSNIDPSVPSNNSEYQWKAIELSQFSQAYDAYRDLVGPVPAVEALLADFAEEAVDQLAMPLQSHNNLTSKLAGGLGMAALVLKDAQNAAIKQQTGTWMALALDHINETFFDYHSAPDGWGGYSEGPYYLRYAMMSLLPLFVTLNSTFQGKNIQIGAETFTDPLNDPRYHRVSEWAAYLRMPDGRLPAFEDTYMDTYFPELAILANRYTDGHFFAWQNYDALTPMPFNALASHLSETYDFRIEYLRWENGLHGIPADKPQIRHMPDAGYSVFRSSWAPDATYFAMIGKHGKARTGGSAFGSGHKHANETGFILAAGGQLLAIEPAYYQYSYRDSLIFGQNHNIILVDGKGPDRTSLLNFMLGVDAYIEDTLSGQWGGTSTVRTKYEDTDIRRTAVMLDDMFVLLRDKAASSSPHTYTHQVHGNGLASAGTFELDPVHGTGTWHTTLMKLYAHVGAVDAAVDYETVTRKHAPTYRVFDEHSAMYSNVSGSAATFCTLLLPAPETSIVAAQTLQAPAGVYAVGGTSGTRPFFAGINTTGTDVEIQTIIGNVSSDAAMTAIAGDITAGFNLFFEEATEFSFAESPLIRCDQPTTLTGRFTNTEIDATVSGEDMRELSIFLYFEPDTVIGTGFSSYVMQGNRLVLQIPNGRADFSVQLSSIPTSALAPGAIHTFRVGAAYPMPARGIVTVPVTAAAPGVLALTLYSPLGEEVYRTVRTMYEPGTTSVVASFPAQLRGPFLLRVSQGGNSSVQTVMLR